MEVPIYLPMSTYTVMITKYNNNLFVKANILLYNGLWVT